VYLAYRLRRPVGEGRGVAVVVARSPDGVRFEPVAQLEREAFGAESLERPALVARPGGGVRIYLSCATPGSKHWWIEAIDADRPEDLPGGSRHRTIDGGPENAFKDPVIDVGPDGWTAWLCRHPLEAPGNEDRMATTVATSADGLAWELHGDVLVPTPGTWDARGTRVTAVLSTDPLVVLYDGRASAEENWHERTGIAMGSIRALRTETAGPFAESPWGDHALRYVAALRIGGRVRRTYFEASRPDGAHDLVTQVVPE
jgi:hypothetical protein